MRFLRFLAVVTLYLFVVSLHSAMAAPIIYEAIDPAVGPGDPRPNSDNKASEFDADAGVLGDISIIDFEGLPVGNFGTLTVAPGVDVTLNGTANEPYGGISTTEDVILGYNTTSGGAKHLGLCPIFNIGTASAVFDFDMPIQAFGVYLTGLGTANGNLHVLFDDGSIEDIPVAGYQLGGVQFFGFTSARTKIMSVTLELQNVVSDSRDVFGIDDVRFVESKIRVPFDIKPGSCPNPLNVKSKGVLPVAILGSDTLDVRDIDVASLNILGVNPIRSSYEDVATPTDSTDCACTTEGPDGYEDLTLKFDRQELLAAIGDVDDGEYITLTITGVTMYDEISIEGSDCILITK